MHIILMIYNLVVSENSEGSEPGFYRAHIIGKNGFKIHTLLWQTGSNLNTRKNNEVGTGQLRVLSGNSTTIKMFFTSISL